MLSLYRKIFLSFLTAAICSAIYADDEVVTKQYNLVTSVSDLAAGDTIVVVCQEYETIMGGVPINNSTSYRAGQSIDEKADDWSYVKMLSTSTVDEIILEDASDGNWYFKLVSTDQYFYADGTYTSSANNYFKLKDTADDSCVAQITIADDGSTTVYYINNMDDEDSDSYDLRCYKSNSGSYRFNCYRKNYYEAINVYKANNTTTESTDGDDDDEDDDNKTIILYGTSANDDNTDVINSSLNTEKDITLTRSFIADGGWYTLCLPFALTADDISDVFKGASFEEFSSVTYDDDVVYLNFTAVTNTAAGVPYMIKPVEDVENPTFTGKTITVTEPDTITKMCESGELECSFIGIFNPTELPSDKSVRFIGSNGTSLTYASNSGGKLYAFRAYIKLPDDAVSAKIITADDELANIALPVQVEVKSSSCYYNLNGQYVGSSAADLQKGVYIKDGNKILIK